MTAEVVWVAVPDRRNSSRDDVPTSDGVRTPMRPLSWQPTTFTHNPNARAHPHPRTHTHHCRSIQLHAQRRTFGTQVFLRKEITLPTGSTPSGGVVAVTASVSGPKEKLLGAYREIAHAHTHTQEVLCVL